MTSGTYLPELTKWPNLGEDSSHSDIFKSSNEGNEKYRRLCNLIKKKNLLIHSFSEDKTQQKLSFCGENVLSLMKAVTISRIFRNEKYGNLDGHWV